MITNREVKEAIEKEISGIRAKELLFFRDKHAQKDENGPASPNHQVKIIEKIKHAKVGRDSAYF